MVMPPLFYCLKPWRAISASLCRQRWYHEIREEKRGEKGVRAMKRLLVLIIALALVLMTAGIAFAHGGGGFRVFIGLPLFFGYSYPSAYYGYPAPYSYYQPRTRVYAEPPAAGTVVENIYVNGRLVERRVKVYDDRYRYDQDRGYYLNGDYGRR